LLIACGVGLAFVGPGRASDWCLAAFAVSVGLCGFLSGARPLLGPDAARLVGPAAVACAVIATGAGVASLWLGATDPLVVLWLVAVGGAGVAWAVPPLVRRMRGRSADQRPEG
jgi:hypothetical protein